jgi:hypothetical protein
LFIKQRHSLGVHSCSLWRPPRVPAIGISRCPTFTARLAKLGLVAVPVHKVLVPALRVTPLTRYKSTNLGRFDIKLARLHASPMAFPGSWPAEPAKCLVVAKSTDVAFFSSLAFLNDLKVSKSSVGTAEETQSLSWKQQGTPAERNAATRTSLHRCSCCLCPPFPSVGIRIAVVPTVGSGGGGRGGCGAQCLHGLHHGCYHCHLIDESANTITPICSTLCTTIERRCLTIWIGSSAS